MVPSCKHISTLWHNGAKQTWGSKYLPSYLNEELFEDRVYSAAPGDGDGSVGEASSAEITETQRSNNTNTIDTHPINMTQIKKTQHKYSRRKHYRHNTGRETEYFMALMTQT